MQRADQLRPDCHLVKHRGSAQIGTVALSLGCRHFGEGPALVDQGPQLVEAVKSSNCLLANCNNKPSLRDRSRGSIIGGLDHNGWDRRNNPTTDSTDMSVHSQQPDALGLDSRDGISRHD